MYLFWGPVPLRVTRLVGYDAQAVFDPSGVDYLYTTYTVSFEACWGRLADGYTVGAFTFEGPVPQLLAVALRNVANGVLSVNATRHALSQPRQPMVLFTVNAFNQPQILLGNGGIDAANGPVMLEPPSVQSVHGGGTLVFVRGTFQVSITDCPLYDAPRLPATQEVRTGGPPNAAAIGSVVGGAAAALGARHRIRRRRLTPDVLGGIVGGAGVSAIKTLKRRETQFDGTELAKARGDQGLRLLTLEGRPLLLSNRWTQSVSYNPENEAPSYRLVGQATFRRDGLQAFRIASIDSFRGSLLPIVPDSCVRSINDITVSADGLTLQYDVTDTMQIRSYVDWRVTKSSEDRSGLKSVGEEPRHIAKVSLVSSRAFYQPSIGNAAFNLIDNLVNVQFALPREDAAAAAAAAGAAGGPAGAAGGAVAGFLAAPFVKLGIAAARTANDSLLPRTVEAARAEVQVTRRGTLADAQALAFALISGALEYGTGAPDGRVPGILGFLDLIAPKAAQVARFFLLAPANEITLECDHVNGIVRAGMQIEQSGIVDFVNAGQANAYLKLMAPLRDEVVGGIPPASYVNVLKAIAELPGIGNLLDDFTKQLGIVPFSVLVKLVSATSVTSKYAGELLVTDADLKLRGPDQDNYSRTSVDVILRSAALLLKPCGQQRPPANLNVEAFPKERTIEIGGGRGNNGNVNPLSDSALDAKVRDFLDKNP